MDVDRFQKYRVNHIDPGDLETINVKNHSAYIDIARASASTIIEKSVFSVAAYQEVLWLRGGDVGRFDKAINAKFPLSTKGSQVPDKGKVSINHVMCARALMV